MTSPRIGQDVQSGVIINQNYSLHGHDTLSFHR
jgi:hypothetical protein